MPLNRSKELSMLTEFYEWLRTTVYRVVPYRFETEEAKDRFHQAAVRPTGSVILRDLEAIARSTGASVPRSLVARSRYEPDMLAKPLIKYFTKPEERFDGRLLHAAVSRVRRAFYVGKLTAMDLEKVVYKPNTNAGAPTFAKKGEVYPEELKRARRIRRGEAPPPAAIFHRGKNEEVVRPVFAYPMAMTLLESRFFEPYQREVMYHHNPYVGGRTYPQLAGEVNELCWKSEYLIELDYSGFDGSISPRLIDAAFDIVANCFEMSTLDEQDWAKVKTYFTTCPVLLPSGDLVIGKRHGVPSGSMFTQLIGSIVNCICIEYWRLRSGTRVSRYHVLGDDSVVGVADSKPNLLDVIGAIGELGITVNVEKSKVRRVTKAYPYFLGHYWNHMKPTRDLEETWEKVLTPERVQREFFSKDKLVRNRIYIERLRDYQNDNQDGYAWFEMQHVIDLLNGLDLKQTKVDDDAYRYKPSKAFNERSWDESVARMKAQRPGRSSRYMYAL